MGSKLVEFSASMTLTCNMAGFEIPKKNSSLSVFLAKRSIRVAAYSNKHRHIHQSKSEYPPFFFPRIFHVRMFSINRFLVTGKNTQICHSYLRWRFHRDFTQHLYVEHSTDSTQHAPLGLRSLVQLQHRICWHPNSLGRFGITTALK